MHWHVSNLDETKTLPWPLAPFIKAGTRRLGVTAPNGDGKY
jgi:hypothetical protein